MRLEREREKKKRFQTLKEKSTDFSYYLRSLKNEIIMFSQVLVKLKIAYKQATTMQIFTINKDCLIAVFFFSFESRNNNKTKSS